jgi:hypothetical protein
MLRPLGLLGLLLCGSAAVAGGQDPVPEAMPTRADSARSLDLPDEVADAVIDFLNDPRRVQLTGPTRVEADSTIRSDIAVLEGPLVIAGRVEGSVLVVNGDAELLPGGAITGDLLVVGGEVRGAQQAVVGGEMLAYLGRLSYRREGERIIRVRRPIRSRASRDADPMGEWGRGDFLITTGKSYNRVEGLPITFGPRIETEGSNPLRVQALAIYRTEAGLTLDTERMGYYVRAEQFLGGRRTLRLGLSAHSLVDPIEDWHLSDLENGLATFVFHRDFRDHYEREGVTAFASWNPREAPLEVQTEVRWERHGSQPAGSPWTLFDNGQSWRPQPLVAEGDLASVALQAGFDSRSRAADPSTGWLLRGRVERGFDVDLALPEQFVPQPGGAVPGVPIDPARPRSYDRFTTGILDVRRYNRVDPRSRLNFRLLLAGSLDGSALPPQRQHAFGGEGSMPGFELFEFDCGARSELVYRSAADAGEASGALFPHYGCDALAMLQAEFRGKLSFRLRWDDAPWDEEEEEEEDEGWGFGWSVAPDWSVFVDAGRGWAMDGRPDEELAVDAGVGLLVDRFGIYLAKPLTGGRGVNIFLRLGPRF